MVRRWYLSKKEVKNLKKQLLSIYKSIPLDFNVVEKIVEKNYPEIIVIDGIPSFFIHENRFYPLLTLLLKKGIEWFDKIIVVDMGAVKPLLRGADVMIPGIIKVRGSFNEGDPVVVIDEKYNKPFVVGKALLSSQDIIARKQSKGKAIKNLHRIGDKLWDLVRSI